jgi:signal peptidase I
MSILSNRKSYAETVEGRRRFLSRLAVLLIVFLAFEFVAGLFLTSFSLSSKAMEPSLSAGDYVLASPLVYGPSTFLGKIPSPVKPARGDLVLVDPPYIDRPSFGPAFADALLRFLSFQRFSLLARRGSSVQGPFVERVIALPGDTVEMEDFVFRVKAAGSQHFLGEFELSDQRYDVRRPARPEGWSDADPLSSSMPALVLGNDEYFLASDNRGLSSDSRLWGPVGLSRFRAKVLLRYWPFRHFGLP